MRNFSSKHSLLCLAKYRLYMSFETISDAAFTFDPANSTACILFFKVKVCIINLWTVFFKQFWHENHPVNAAFLTNLFIRTNRDLKFCQIWTLCKNFTKILQALGSSATQDTRVLEALWHVRYSGTQDTWDTNSTDSSVLH